MSPGVFIVCEPGCSTGGRRPDMAEGLSNGGIARQLWVSEATVEKHVHSILMKLQLPDGDDVNRRVLAVLAFPRGRFTRLSFRRRHTGYPVGELHACRDDLRA
jgi:hypothetical protein